MTASFYVLEGEITFPVGDQRIVATAGTFAKMPVGSLHSFKNATDKIARMIISVAPAGLEKMFLEFGVPVNLTTYTHILDLAKEAEPPADGVLSRTIYQDDRVKAVVSGSGQGQELSEHTAAKPAMLFFVKGKATVGLGDDVRSGGASPHACQT